MPFTFTRLAVPDVVLIEARVFADSRGFFRETFKASEFGAFGLPTQFTQGNHSHSAKHVLRGLHYQKDPQAQGKLLSVGNGEIFDVAVDIRQGSPTYGKWVGEVLSHKNGRMLWVPAGFAHGFCVISDTADLCYQVTTEWVPQLETGIAWNDPAVGIVWPTSEPILSPKDAVLPPLAQADNNFIYQYDEQISPSKNE